jgi:hypothetical protein
MITFDTLIEIFGDTFLGGNVGIAGTIVLVGVLAFIMAITKKVMPTMVLALPLIMVFAVLGWLPAEVGIMMLIVVALLIGLEARGVFS